MDPWTSCQFSVRCFFRVEVVQGYCSTVCWKQEPTPEEKMFDKKPASLLSLCFLVCVTEGLTNITAEPGDTVTLTCRAPSSSEIRVIEWTRPDLKTDYVFVYRKKRFDPDSQHPSFKERVELKDSQMKDGDVSVTLKNVTFTDNGTYECRVAQGQTDPLKHISTIHLRVSAGECVFV
ncbi:coxsackievirus and adenovirus receptor-like [Mastacembelus armatus]|uniref:coxsackievirus and adenovirus receptor-like n=1 Tax=Mastacembelus armatus TaxID=205130 RepID=UPI00143683D7|nr:coxsackievirus and adenovirus receptor-like [Mastacembelus armatus]